MYFENIMGKYGWYIIGILAVLFIYFFYKKYKKQTCSKCGNKVKEKEALFCGSCGEILCEHCYSTSNWLKDVEMSDGTYDFCSKSCKEEFEEDSDDDTDEDDEEDEDEDEEELENASIDYYKNNKYAALTILQFDDEIFDKIEELERKGYKTYYFDKESILYRKED